MQHQLCSFLAFSVRRLHSTLVTPPSTLHSNPHSFANGRKAIAVAATINKVTPTPSSESRTSRFSKAAVIPPKKSTTLKNTVRRRYLSEISLACLTSTNFFSSSWRNSRISCSTASEYSFITKGVRGADGFFSGLVVNHASAAVLNSGRKRWKRTARAAGYFHLKRYVALEQYDVDAAELVGEDHLRPGLPTADLRFSDTKILDAAPES